MINDVTQNGFWLNIIFLLRFGFGPSRVLAYCREWTRVILFCCRPIYYAVWFSELHLHVVCVFSCTGLLVQLVIVIGCEDHLFL